MSHLDLIVLVNRPQSDVYDYLADPYNLSALNPRLSSINLRKKTTNEQGVTILSSEATVMFRLLGISLVRRRIYVDQLLTRPPDEMEHSAHSTWGTNVQTLYQVRPEGNATQVKIRITVEAAKPWLENFAYETAVNMQRTSLANLKSLLEGKV